MKLSLLIPVYNEERTLDMIFDKVFAIGESPLIDELEVIAVDDCSKDNSFNLLKKYEADGKIRLFRHEKNQGKGAAIRTAVSNATGDYVVFQDADLEYDPQDLLKMLDYAVKNNVDVLYGSRFLGKKTSPLGKFHYFVNAGLTTLSNLFTGLSLTDMETCYKMFKGEVLKEINIEEDRFGLEPEITAKTAKICAAKNLIIKEFPISYNPRKSDEGKKIGAKDGLRAVYIILKYGFFE
ncbi:glycosyltransferase family 2 protein [bacterium]|jgi:glycosyltransferase involved in cell wall biosynthesis|nr:glycosyltransferase family 2 protein [bacterium]